MNPQREPRLETTISDEPPVVLVAERLRDGRVALGTRTRRPDGSWDAGEMILLEPAAQLDLAGWLSTSVEDRWAEAVARQQGDALRTARELYGEGPGALSRLALETVQEIPPDLLARAMTLLANAIGPRSRERLVERLNQTSNRSEEQELRRRLAEEHEGFAYALAAAAMFDALANGIFPEDVE